MFDFIWGNPVSRFLVTLGIVLILAGIVWPFLQRMGIGRLPSDIVVERDEGYAKSGCRISRARLGRCAHSRRRQAPAGTLAAVPGKDADR